MRGRTPVLVIGLLLALLVVGALAAASTAGPAGDAAGNPSSRNAGRDGTLALYSWLGDLGFDVHRATGDLDLGATDVLFSVAPSESFTDSEIARVDTFLRGGGELVLAVDPSSLSAAQPMLDHLGLAVDHATGPGSASPTAPLEPAGAVSRVRFEDGSLDLGRAGVPLMRLPEGAVALAGFSVGGGRVYVLGSPYPLGNEGLRPSRPMSDGVLAPTLTDADALVLALLERSRPSDGRVVHIAVDEVHHGEGSNGGLSAILVSPIGLAMLLALLIVLAWLVTSGRRLGRAVPAGDPTAVPSAATFVRAMAQLYERSAQRGAVADRYAEELKGRVSAASGVDPHLEDARFVAALAGHGQGRADEVGRVLAAARQLAAGAPGDQALLDLARRVDQVEQRWSAGMPV